MRGGVPMILGATGFSELFAPDFLSQIVVGTEMAMAMFAGGCGYFGFSIAPGMTRGSASKRKSPPTKGVRDG